MGFPRFFTQEFLCCRIHCGKHLCWLRPTLEIWNWCESYWKLAPKGKELPWRSKPEAENDLGISGKRFQKKNRIHWTYSRMVFFSTFLWLTKTSKKKAKTLGKLTGMGTWGLESFARNGNVEPTEPWIVGSCRLSTVGKEKCWSMDVDGPFFQTDGAAYVCMQYKEVTVHQGMGLDSRPYTPSLSMIKSQNSHIISEI